MNFFVCMAPTLILDAYYFFIIKHTKEILKKNRFSFGHLLIFKDMIFYLLIKAYIFIKK